MLTYRKTKQGEWVACGPVAEVKLGPCTVCKRDGSSKSETITKVGKPFPVDGVDHAYGYLAKTDRPSSPSTSGGGSARRCRDCKGPIVNAAHHRAMGGLCGHCAFDEYDM